MSNGSIELELAHVNVASRLAWNSVVAWISSLAGGIGGFILVRYLIAHLGAERYGVAELLDTLVVFTMLSDLGVRAALSRHLAEHIARADARRVNQLLTFAAVCYVGIALLLFALCWLLTPVLVHFSNISPGPQREAALWLVRLFVPAYTLAMFAGTSSTAVIESHHRFDIVDVIHTGEIILRLLLIFVAIGFLQWGLWGWAAGYLVAKAMSAGCYMSMAWRLTPTIRVRPRYFDWSAGRELFSLGGLILLYQTVVRLSAQTDPFILTAFLGPLAVALYKPAFRLTAAAQPFVGVVNRQLRPLATTYFVQGRSDLLGELLTRGTKVSFMLALPFVVIFTCFAHPLIELWLAEPQFAVTAWLLVIWALADLAAHIGNAQFFILLGMNRVRVLVGVQTIAAVVNVTTSIVLIAIMVHRGASREACVLAIIVPTLVVAWTQRAVITVRVAHEVGIGLPQYLVRGFLPPVLVGIGLAFIAFAIRSLLQPDTWARLLIAIALVGLVWIPLVWWLGFDGEDRRRVGDMIRRRRSGSSAGENSSETATLQQSVE